MSCDSPKWVKNGPDAVEMDFCFTPKSRHRSGYAADCDIVICGGNAKPEDTHLASIIHCGEFLARNAAPHVLGLVSP